MHGICQVQPTIGRNLTAGSRTLAWGTLCAHLAVFLNTYLQRHPEHWMIHGVGLREADSGLIEAMDRQNDLYTLPERSGSRDTFKIVGSIKECSFAPGNE